FSQKKSIMQKRFFTAFAVFIWATLSFAQIHEPVKWNFSSKNIKGNDVELILTAVIEKGWHLYSQNLPSDEGPIATSFNFNKNSDFELIGNVVEPKPKTDYDPNFDMEIPYFDTKVD